MSFTRELNNSNDLSIIGGTFKYISNTEEVIQRLKVTLAHNWQEYFMNVPSGVPWYELILGGKNKEQTEIILRGIIMDVPGVVSIVSLISEFSNRALSISLSVEVFVDGVTDILDFSLTYYL